MAIKFKVKAKDEVPAELQALYVERDGGWVLDADGAVDKSKLEEGAEIEHLVTRLDPERGERAADPGGADDADFQRMRIGRLVVSSARRDCDDRDTDRGEESTRAIEHDVHVESRGDYTPIPSEASQTLGGGLQQSVVTLAEGCHDGFSGIAAGLSLLTSCHLRDCREARTRVNLFMPVA